MYVAGSFCDAEGLKNLFIPFRHLITIDNPRYDTNDYDPPTTARITIVAVR